MTRGTVQRKWRRTVNACGELARPTDLDIHRGPRTTNQTRDRRILPRGCPREAGSYGARQSEGDENGIIIPVKWCSLVSLSIKAWCPLSLHSAEKILDRRDLVRKRLNESPLRHHPPLLSHFSSLTSRFSMYLSMTVSVDDLTRRRSAPTFVGTVDQGQPRST